MLAAMVSAFPGYVVHLLQSRVPTKDNQDNLSGARREEALQHFRWAA
ncbi:MAG: hypothetical protein M3519_01910 [Actinomycetota bacterium]|nr:hypothetical protein [Actinomycetota bacterium]